MASITSLGLGSGVLTSDVLDKLKSAETTAIIGPIDKSIAAAQSKKSAVASLILSLSSVKTAAMDLSSENAYLKRTATSSNSSAVGISVSSGVEIQDMAVSVSQIAQNHVMQSKGYATESSTISTAEGKVKLSLGSSTSYEIAVTAGMTLEQFAQKINDVAGSSVTASILNTGEGSSPYRLIVKSKNTGETNEVTFSDTEGAVAADVFSNSKIVGASAASDGKISMAEGDILINGISIGAVSGDFGGSKENADKIAEAINAKTADTNVKAEVDSSGKITLTNIEGGEIKITTKNGAAAESGLFSEEKTDYTVDALILQQAKDAKFTYNGISMTRSSNSVSDISVGMTLNLYSTTTSDVNLTIKQDVSQIPTDVDTFVTAYNSLASKLTDLTKYDADTKTAGALQGVSDVTSIMQKLGSFITEQNEDGVSLVDYGFELDKNGNLSVDKSVLNEKLEEDPSALEKLFRGAKDITKASYTARNSAIASSGITVPAGGITINGVEIGSVTTASTDVEVNAQAFAEAINAAYEQTGVKAYTNGSGKLILEQPGGGEIKVQTTSDAATASGLSAVAGSGVGLSNVTVGYGSVTTEDGMFTKINSMLADLITSDSATLQMYDKSLQTQVDTATEEKEKALKTIEDRFNLMAAQFAMYDKLISRYSNNFGALEQQIKASQSK